MLAWNIGANCGEARARISFPDRIPGQIYKLFKSKQDLRISSRIYSLPIFFLSLCANNQFYFSIVYHLWKMAILEIMKRDWRKYLINSVSISQPPPPPFSRLRERVSAIVTLPVLKHNNSRGFPRQPAAKYLCNARQLSGIWISIVKPRALPRPPRAPTSGRFYLLE